MVPSIEVLSSNGYLAADYHSAAILSNCRVKRNSETLGSTTSTFTAQVDQSNPFWIRKVNVLILELSQNVFWCWPVLGNQVLGNSITGLIDGDPDILTSIPVCLRKNL
jgi:hypothetical protein